MYRLIVSMVVVLLVAGCGSENEKSGSNGDDVATTTSVPGTTPPPEGSGTQVIPDPVSPGEEGMTIAVYADEAGTTSELAVAPGEMFSIYVLAEVESSYRISAAQYRLELPEGIELFSEHKLIARSMTIGDPTQNFNIAFVCMDPGIFGLMKYTCQATSAFSGGNLSVGAGVSVEEIAFRGLVTCPDDGQLLTFAAAGGTLSLSVK